MCVLATTSDGTVLVGTRGDERLVNRVHVVAVDVLHLPAARREAPAHVLEKRDVRRRRKGDAVGVVEDDQPAEPQRPGQRRRFAGQPFHHVAVTRQDIGAVIDDGVRRAIEGRGQPPFGDRQTNGVTQPLPERTGGHLDARRAAAFGMARRPAAPLAKLLQSPRGTGRSRVKWRRL